MKTLLSTTRALAAAFLFGFTPAVAQGATYFVATTGNDSNPGTQAQPFRTIAKGVATAIEGDSVEVGAGTYSEHVAWSGKGIVLEGAGAGQSIIDGGGSGTCIALSGVPSTCRVAGFTLRNGAASPGAAAGLTSIGNGSPTVADCVFSNHAGSGTTGLGAFTTDSGNPTLLNCSFLNNTVSGVNLSGGYLTVTRGTFTNNRGYFGGAMDVENGQLHGHGCTLSNNSSSFLDCQVGQKGSLVELNSSLLADTTSHPSFYFAVQALFSSTIQLDHSTVVAASAQIQCQQQSFLLMRDSVLWGTGGPNAGVGLLNGSAADISYSNLPGGAAGQGNLATDPLFANAAASNFRLQSTSPCRDSGTTYSPFPISDLDGAPRTMGSAPDRGAYEFWTAASGTWFVDKALGNDTTGVGSPGAPFKTVVKAITTASTGNNLYVKQGNYGTDRPRITKRLKFYNWLSAGRASIGKP